jgi:hypothetical protein
MTAIGLRVARPRAVSLPLHLPAITPARLAFLAYLLLGSYLAIVLHAYHGDAYSRVANAYYVLFSRDPHLAAIGFVWAPLPSLFELAFMPIKLVWPAFAKLALAAVIMSATFMALAVREVDRMLADFRLGRASRLALVAAFALHPAILYYGAIGTSEAPTLFFALLACRHLARYAVAASTPSLIGVGMGLAGAYLTRYEALPSAVGVGGMILLLGLLRLPGRWTTRLERSAADLAVALTPFVLVFVGWAIASWIIVGSPFTQFTSDYGNSSQMRVWAAAGVNEIGLPFGESIVLAVLRVGALSAIVPLAVVAGLWLLVRRSDYRVLAIAAVLGPLLASMVLLYVLHILAPWLRYFISVVPMGILVVGLMLAPRTSRVRRARPSARANDAPARASLGARLRSMPAASRAYGGRWLDAASATARVTQDGFNRLADWGDAVVPQALLKVRHALRVARYALTIALTAVHRHIWTQVLALLRRQMAPARVLIASRRAGWTDPFPALTVARHRMATARSHIGSQLVMASSRARTAITARGVAISAVAADLPDLRPLARAAAVGWRSWEVIFRVEAAAVAAASGTTDWLARTAAATRDQLARLDASRAALASGLQRRGRSIGAALAPAARRLRGPARAVGFGMTIGLVLLSVPVAAAGMLNRTIAIEESRDVNALLGPDRAAPDRTGAAVRTFALEGAVASYLDNLDLPRGAVLMDVFSAFPIVLLSDHPDQFVITTDRDFKQALADPSSFGVRYLLVPSIQGHGVLDAVNKAYPELPLTTDFARPVHVFPAFGTSSTWTLYELSADFS